VAQQFADRPPEQVIGSGTVLDTARFRHLLGRHFDVDPRNVHAYMLGEHGDSEVPLWSLANIAGMRLPDYCESQGLAYDPDAMAEIAERTRNAAYEIIDRKGATNYAIAAGLLRIVEAIVRDQNTVLTVSTLLDGEYGIEDVCLSLPCVIGQHGLERRLDAEMNDEEVDKLHRSAAVIRENIDQLEID
ncbi:MAG: L-lactate dehydrogenase, partial [Bradymonadaceae bacterium]